MNTTMLYTCIFKAIHFQLKIKISTYFLLYRCISHMPQYSCSWSCQASGCISPIWVLDVRGGAPPRTSKGGLGFPYWFNPSLFLINLTWSSSNLSSSLQSLFTRWGWSRTVSFTTRATRQWTRSYFLVLL